jgi:hypothetical protein
MRLDESGQSCPATLGEYRRMCVAIGGKECKAVKLLDEKIAESNEDDKVIVADSQMRMLLMPLLITEDG